MESKYRYLERGPEALIEASELPVEAAIAISVRSTGYECDKDEALSLVLTDIEGKVLFFKQVKPQNVENWKASPASGLRGPVDVAQEPDLYQFEDEIVGIIKQASIVVGLHIEFAINMIEAGWITLPSFRPFDLTEGFCLSHSETSYPLEPSPVTTLRDISDYYGLDFPVCDELDEISEAQLCAACYRELVQEHVREREKKSDSYWKTYQAKQADIDAAIALDEHKERMRKIKSARINAILWLCATTVFANLSVQLYVHGFDLGFTAIAAAAAIFFLVKCLMCLRALSKLKQR